MCMVNSFSGCECKTRVNYLRLDCRLNRLLSLLSLLYCMFFLPWTAESFPIICFGAGVKS